ncbi:MAG: crossover junction endodeoxyribonuclease RuvC [Actinobacteria bacterium]|nr:crossover junction endodeoxyribonuclease RuvC [Actinomycetota bacterium]
MRVLGVDPGYATTGYAVIERARGGLAPVAIGTIRTSGTDGRPERLAFLRSELLQVIAEHAPAAVALERLFFTVNARTAMAVGQASGVAMATAGEAGLEVTEYTPTEVKQSVTGTGTAPKHQVQAMIAALLHLAEIPKPPDAADACALAICHLNRSGLSKALARAGGAR